MPAPPPQKPTFPPRQPHAGQPAPARRARRGDLPRPDLLVQDLPRRRGDDQVQVHPPGAKRLAGTDAVDGAACAGYAEQHLHGGSSSPPSRPTVSEREVKIGEQAKREAYDSVQVKNRRVQPGKGVLPQDAVLVHRHLGANPPPRQEPPPQPKT